MRYHTGHFILQYWDRNKKKYVDGHTSRVIDHLERMAKKPYYNYPWMGKKRILHIQIYVCREYK